MNTRHPDNSNLILHTEPYWNGYPVYTQRGPLIANYLQRIAETFSKALNDYPRLTGFRFDLHPPAGIDSLNNEAISRFMASLNAQLEADYLRKVREGKRAYPCRLRYVWAREYGESGRVHYHVLILVNRDAYFTLGNYRTEAELNTMGLEDRTTNMADRLTNAWASALGLSPFQAAGLVHFPNNPVYAMNANAEDFQQQLAELFYRVSYFAKADTKQYGTNANAFGSSRS